jgi:hypothetical protein
MNTCPCRKTEQLQIAYEEGSPELQGMLRPMLCELCGRLCPTLGSLSSMPIARAPHTLEYSGKLHKFSPVKKKGEPQSDRQFKL